MATALAAADAGLSVVILERRPCRLDKACGEGLMPGAVAALVRLGVDPEGSPIAGITYRQEDLVARAAFRRGPGRGVRRTVLVSAMRAAVAARGIEMVERSVADVVRGAGSVTAAGVRARYAVAADGLHSAVRGSLGLARPARAPRRWGLRRHFALPPWTDHVEVWWSRASEAYVTPVGGGLVGVAILSSQRSDFDTQLADFPELRDRLCAAPAASEVLGSGPLLQPVGRRAVGRVLLVGDAAGYVDALTGEGLGAAFVSAEALVECVVRDRPQDYERAWARATLRSRLMTSALLRARHNPLLHRRIVPAAARLPRVFSRAVDQLAH